MLVSWDAGLFVFACGRLAFVCICVLCLSRRYLHFKVSPQTRLGDLGGQIGVQTNSSRLNIDFIAPFFRYDHPQQRVRIWPSMEVGLKQRKCIAINAMCGWRWLGFAIPLEGDRKRGNDDFQSHALNTRNQWGCRDMKYLKYTQTTLGKNKVRYINVYINIFHMCLFLLLLFFLYFLA